MAGEPNLTVVGNATADAELRFLPSGVAVANFTLASTPRVKKNDGNWEDGDTVFYRVTVWRDAAEHVAESVKRGMRLLVTGRFRVRPYEVEGQTRQSLEIDADEVGVALRYGTATFNKAERVQAGTPAPAYDPWSTGPGATPQPPAQQGWGAPDGGPPPGWSQPAPQQPAAPPQQQGGWGDVPPPPY